ncbi:MAG: methyltransferase domain-containing protein [Chitinophagaceae bacterium]|nr:methyltransferase domain-containing protein [Oligoflexus sp.]
MDQKTHSYYSTHASAVAALYEDLGPDVLYEQIQAFFKKDGLTLDVGSGSGRDVAWLSSKGFEVLGIEPTAELIEYARKKHPKQKFSHGEIAQVPALLKGKKAANILCSGVLMHVPSEELISSVQKLIDALAEDGTLIISTRPGGGIDDRDEHGRLFTSLPTGKTILLFESLGASLINVVQSQDGPKTWDIFIFRKQSKSKYDGLHKIQEIINNDSKTTSYKFALLRSLCEVARKEIHAAQWKADGSTVLIDVRILAEKWVQYYEGFVSAGISQIKGRNLAFQSELAALKERYPTRPVFEFKRAQVAIVSPELTLFTDRLIQKIGHAILEGPVKYSGGGAQPAFRHEVVKGNSCVAIPTRVWMDIIHFSHWIEDSLILQWASWTKSLSAHYDKQEQVFRESLVILTADHNSPRDTQVVKDLLIENQAADLLCAWSKRLLTPGIVHIDHIIPYSAIGLNSLWNLVPTHPSVNLSKSDKMPDGAQFGDSEELIVSYWQMYAKVYPTQFFNETARSLGVKDEKSWEKKSFGELMLLAQRIAYNQGLKSWRVRRTAGG